MVICDDVSIGGRFVFYAKGYSYDRGGWWVGGRSGGSLPIWLGFVIYRRAFWRLPPFVACDNVSIGGNFGFYAKVFLYM